MPVPNLESTLSDSSVFSDKLITTISSEDLPVSRLLGLSIVTISGRFRELIENSLVLLFKWPLLLLVCIVTF
jgi:hypothetical protein